MIRLPALLAASVFGTAFASALAPTPAAAQDEGGDRVNQVIIFGEDACPVSTGETITVCARLDESERYRIPERLRNSTSPQNEAWAQRFQSLEAVGAFGPLSCTPVGAGGDLGCTVEMIEQAYAARAAGTDVRMAELVAEARQERYAEIEGDAAAYQARVEVLEEAEFERRRQAQSQTLPGEAPQEDAVLVNPAAIPQTPPPTDTIVND
ncbi:hypothetical protein GRI62_13890 [Erythrobacter arachoides]|uniref:Secreted protein n=1 Tax=Aurantiacibacter arachoides TaxID=1850444 RepID=A0A845A2C7_9SPHN|nr:hypothetical protein [Aurantiacibacter arachoides]MXO94691.1 hypothetical protein [Aurantiacibacter arachoides]GGD61436.1 hypothetical protein GCM10011411_22120 [Aurantiacibacter arachoides]